MRTCAELECGVLPKFAKNYKILKMKSGRVVGVTGVGGILGGLLRPFLEAKGHTVVGVDRAVPKSQGAPGIPPSVFEAPPSTVDRVCDLAVASSCDSIFDGCTDVVHLAAQGDASAPMEGDVFPNNVQGTINAIEAAKRAGSVRRFVFASTNHVMHGLTMGEEGPGSMSLDRLAKAGGPGALGVAHPFAPDSAYAVSKIFGEMLGKYHATVERDFEFVALRIGWCAFDDPGALEGTIYDEYLRAMWLSKRDAVGFINAAMEVDLDGEQFRVGYATSNNATCPFDVNESAALLGYTPVDGMP